MLLLDPSFFLNGSVFVCMFLFHSHTSTGEIKKLKNIRLEICFPLPNLHPHSLSVDRCTAEHPLTGQRIKTSTRINIVLLFAARMKFSQPPHNHPHVASRCCFFPPPLRPSWKRKKPLKHQDVSPHAGPLDASLVVQSTSRLLLAAEGKALFTWVRAGRESSIGGVEVG